jgi:ArsR family transcriptional regulator, arsenate/arsenite/antimonite-responsive transcriptional repressor
MDAKLAVDSLAALAQESRLLIYRLLVEAGPTGLSVGEIGASVQVAPATLSFHLKELAHSGLVQTRQAGRFIYYSANFGKMNELLGYLTENCCTRQGACGPQACRPAPRARSKAAGVKPATGRRRPGPSKA